VSPEGAAAGDEARAWAELLTALTDGHDLAATTTRWALSEVMSGRADDARLAGLLIGLRAKGETVEEIAGLADGMLAHAMPLPVAGGVLDIVGTGGDGAGTLNISTAAAVVAAASGAVVVKHGNRAASSRCGSADVLEALGVDIDITPEAVAEVAAEIGLTFAFAQRFHPAMRYAAPVRRSLRIRTAFNVLGPLTNPSRPAAMAVGVSDARWAPIVAGVLARNGVTALVFRSDDGVDELTTASGADVWVVVRGEVAHGRFQAAPLGLAPAVLTDLAGGDADTNAARLRQVLLGETGPVADTVALNAAAGLLAADLAGGPAAAGPATALPAAGAPAAGGPATAVPAAGAPAMETTPAPSAAAVADGFTVALRGPLERARGAIADGAASDLLQRWVAATTAR